MRQVLLATLLGLALCGPAAAQIVDHTAVDGVTSLPRAVMNGIGQQRWLFTHASVGSNMEGVQESAADCGVSGAAVELR